MIQSMVRFRVPPQRDLVALRRALLAWHRRHGLRAPWRASGDPYQALVAAVMAQQTQMSRVLLKFDEFIAAFPTVEALAAAPAGEVLRLWAGLGYNLRALRLHRAAQEIARQGGFPAGPKSWSASRASGRSPPPSSPRSPSASASPPSIPTCVAWWRDCSPALSTVVRRSARCGRPPMRWCRQGPPGAGTRR